MSLLNDSTTFSKQLMRQFVWNGNIVGEKEINVMATEMSSCFADLGQYSRVLSGSVSELKKFYSLGNHNKKIVSLAILIFLLMKSVF